jgi:arsenate reductase (thioredoxin)
MTDSSVDGARSDAVSAALRRISDDLASRFTGQLSREAVERCVDESYQSLDQTARIKQFLPVFTRRLAVERLAALAENGSDRRDQH